MKLIKYIFTLLVGATALSLTSCNDFLDRDPLGQFTEDDSPNALVGGKIFNVYYLMRSYDITAGIPAFMVHMVRSEDSEKGSDAGDGSNEAAMWDDFEYTASNGPLSAYWGQNYKIIYQCNEILDDIEKSGHKDDTEAIRNRGEALFFRAWCYFNLVRAFGEVPLVTIKVVEASDANVPKTTAEKIYEQIDKDLTEAEECLPLRWDSDYTGRLTWGAARRIAAESFVLLKNEPFEGQGKKSSRPVLPLEKQGTVAVIGPLGNTRSNMPGTWSVAARLDDYPSLYEGLKEMTAGRVNITYAKGSNLIGDVAYEERATLFGRSLSRDNRTDKELLDEALKVASGADVIVAALGESSEMSGESSSRTDLDIPDVQRTLLEALLKTGKPVVLTLFTGRPLTLTWEQEHVPAILNVWFGGSEAAYAIGDVLFGDVNPSGKLTMTFPKNVGQIPLFYNHKNTGRPLAAGNWFEKFRSNYLDVDNEPLYPFGYGLSYTTFQYSDIALSTPVMGQNGSTTAVVTVTNTGKRDGAEVVQLYIRDLVGSITRPVRELKGFEKVFLKAGESKTVSFKITPELLRFYDYDLNHVAEPGDFDVMIGGSSQAEKIARLTLK